MIMKQKKLKLTIDLEVDREQLIWAAASLLNDPSLGSLSRENVLRFLRNQIVMFGTGEYFANEDWEEELKADIPVATRWVQQNWFELWSPY